VPHFWALLSPDLVQQLLVLVPHFLALLPERQLVLVPHILVLLVLRLDLVPLMALLPVPRKTSVAHIALASRCKMLTPRTILKTHTNPAPRVALVGVHTTLVP
jgi:hypothetical protein